MVYRLRLLEPVEKSVKNKVGSSGLYMGLLSSGKIKAVWGENIETPLSERLLRQTVGRICPQHDYKGGR
jgi:hypothetical protein